VNWSDIPRLDQPGADAGPRAVRFRDAGAAGLERRGFLAVLATGAMTLGMTLLGWIPLARPARAEEGTEYPDCGGYSDGPGGPLCVGAYYSPSYCGDDNWFKNGCFTKSDGTLDCYEPVAACHAGGDEGRDAWRWEANGFAYRCADGKVYHHGAPNPEFVICNATLTFVPTPEALPGLGMLPSLPRLLP
jgi:hypothetical protein